MVPEDYTHSHVSLASGGHSCSLKTLASFEPLNSRIDVKYHGKVGSDRDYCNRRAVHDRIEALHAQISPSGTNNWTANIKGDDIHFIKHTCIFRKLASSSKSLMRENHLPWFSQTVLAKIRLWEFSKEREVPDVVARGVLICSSWRQ